MIKVIVLGIIVWSISIFSLNAANCANGRIYPFKTNTEDLVQQVDYTPGPAENVLSGVAGWFGIGSIEAIEQEDWLQSWLVCCNGEEKTWETSWSAIAGSVSVTPSAGANVSDLLSNIDGAVDGYGYDDDTWEVISDAISQLGISFVSASFSYSANFNAPDTILDECGCGGSRHTADFFGSETYKLTASGPEYDGEWLMFSVLNGVVQYKKQGFEFSDYWVAFSSFTTTLATEYRIGPEGEQAVTINHFSDNPSSVPLGSGSWCSTTLADY